MNIKIIFEKDGWRIEDTKDSSTGAPFMITRYSKKAKRWVRDTRQAYLFSAPDKDDGNAVCVIARSQNDALRCARRFVKGFIPKTEMPFWTIGTEPVVVIADSYYRPELSFQKLDDYSRLSKLQVAEIRRKLDEQHPAGDVR